jgi:hypothetical protein
MAPPAQVLHIDVNQPVPQQQHLPSRFEPAPSEPAPPPAAGSDSLWSRIVNLLPF